MVILSEGDNVNISCFSAGVPIPTISWTLRDQPTPFEKTDLQADIDIRLVRNDNGDLVADITPGSLESTLQKVNAQYPAHHWLQLSCWTELLPVCHHHSTGPR